MMLDGVIWGGARNSAVLRGDDPGGASGSVKSAKGRYFYLHSFFGRFSTQAALKGTGSLIDETLDRLPVPHSFPFPTSLRSRVIA